MYITWKAEVYSLMFIDLLNTENYVQFNVKTANIFGLHTAIYLQLLLSVFEKAQRKNKLIDGYVKLDRSYVTSLTTLSANEQMSIDKQLIQSKVIEKLDDNLIKLDVDMYASLISDDDVARVKKLASSVKTKDEQKVAKKAKLIENLKKHIQCSNTKVYVALSNWIDAIMSIRALSAQAVDIFQDKLYEYTKGDADMAVAIINIAIAQCWAECDWAINSYIKNNKMKERTQVTSVRVTEQKKSTELSEETF